MGKNRTWTSRTSVTSSFLFFKDLFIDLREREWYIHTCTQVGGGAEEENFQSEHGTGCSAWSHDPWDHDLSWNQELGHLTDWATQAPPAVIFYHDFQGIQYSSLILGFGFQDFTNPLSTVVLKPMVLLTYCQKAVGALHYITVPVSLTSLHLVM